MREGTLKSLDYKSYTCRDVDLCNNVDCDDCVFGKDDIFTLEEIKKRLIKEDWLCIVVKIANITHEVMKI